MSSKPIQDAYPLSPMQQGMLFHSLYEPTSGVYVNQLSCDLRGVVDITAFIQAWQQVIDRHTVLRTAFVWDTLEKPLQIVGRQVTLPWQLDDWRSLSDAEQQQRLQAWLHADRQQGFDLAKAPLMRLTLIQLDAATYRMIWSHHHLLLDGWSVALIFKEVLACYQALCQAQPLNLPAPQPYRDYIAWLQRQDQSQAEAFWRSHLQGFVEPTPLMGTEIQPPGTTTGRRERVEMTLSPTLSAALRSLTQQHRLTLNTVMQGAWALLLSYYSRQDDVVFGSTTAGRPLELANVDTRVGLFINTLPTRIRFSPDAALLPWLQQIQVQQLETRQYEYCSLVDIQGWSDVPRSLPLFQSLMIFENYPLDASLHQGIPDLEISHVQAQEQTNYPLVVMVLPGLELVLQFWSDTGALATTALQRMAGHLQTLLTSMATNPNQRLSDLSLLTAAEREQLVVEWNQTQVDDPQPCLPLLIEAQVDRSPDAIAVQFANQHLTYRELNARANQLAHFLKAQGVQPETLVGICCERSLEMVIGLLGILKAGGAYVPLDPNYPSERLAFMLQDAQVPLLLTQRHLVEHLPTHTAQVICFDADWPRIAQCSQENWISGANPQNLAYIIYTSGSTGQPKGVQISHGALVNLLSAMRQTPGLTAHDTLLAVTTLSFDIAALELYLPLMVGARLVIASRAVASDGHQLLEHLKDAGATVMQATPATWRLLLAAGWLTDLQPLKILCGGEALDVGLAAQLLTRGTAVWNLYGPTETTIWSALCPVDAEWLAAHRQGTVSIGRAIANTQFYVLDAHQRLVPPGVPGELYIGGAGLARGYRHRPDLTAERFVPNPFHPNGSPQLYRTGDLVCYQPDGNLDYLGRLDHQVKVRGFRIELGEIEAVLRQHPDIREAVVGLHADQTGNNDLVAYLVPQAGVRFDGEIAALRPFLQCHLPDYMVPRGFVVLEALPLTPNGKVDRRSLPAPNRDTLAHTSAFAAPNTAIEEILAGIWSEVLGIESVGRQDNFWELGGHSLSATRVVSKLRQVFRIALPLRTVFETPTLAALAQKIATARQAGSHSSGPTLQPLTRTERLPLSFSQQRLWFLTQLEPDSVFYNIPAAIRLQGQLHPVALERSIHAILCRHEILRTRFKTIAGRPVVEPMPFLPQPLPVIDLQGLPANVQDQRLNELIHAEMQQAFDLQIDLMLRVKLLRLSDQAHILLLTMHHIASDGWSIQVLVRELSALYPAFCHDRPSPLPDLPIQYVDFAAWQQQWLTGDMLASQLVYWRQQLAGAPPLLNLPTDFPRPTVPTYRGATYTFNLTAKRLQALKTLSQRHGSTLFMTLLAAFNVLLHRYSGMADVVVGSAIANRNQAELENLIGFFVNTLVLRTDLSGNPTIRELLRRVREVTLGAYAHQDLPFERLVEDLQPPRDPSYNPLFQVMLVLQNAPKSAVELPGLTLTPLPIPCETAKLDLTLYLEELEADLVATLEYNTDLFAASTIQRMADQFQVVLDGMITHPDRHLSELPLLTPSEQQLFVEWNQTQADYPHTWIHHCFEAQVERTPDAVAVVFANQALTYRELNARANQLAHHLQALGVQPETLVGICLERSLAMMIGLLAILKAGGAYVPLDPAYPPERLAFILDDAQVPLLLTQQGVMERVMERVSDPAAQVICMDTDWDAIAHHSPRNPATPLTPEALAYVIYTSGSTGAPKGVLGLHRGALNRLHWMWTTDPFTTADVCCQKTALNFVDSVWEIFGPLLQGIQTVIIPDQVLKDPHTLVATLAQHQVTRLVLVPSLLRVLLDLDPDLQQRLPTLKLWVSSGEALPFDLLQMFRERLPDSTLLNLYGSSEVAADVTSYRVNPQDAVTPPVLIGRAIANTQLHVLDQGLRPVPLGVPGELYVAGAGVARGYLHHPDLTAERFIPNPFSTDPTSRLFKTGDRVRYNPDGNLEYWGRLDHQVKIRGFRIEPGEIEWVLRQSPAVHHAVVVAREDQPGNPQLVAYVVAAPQQSITVSALRSHLKQTLPDYMLPSAWVVLDELPLLPNGKLDRRALPLPERTRLVDQIPDQAPYTDLERAIATLWQTCLNLQTIGIHDNFFDLGGHSLLLVQVHSQLQQHLHREFPLVELFQYPTIQALAQHLSPQSQQPSTPQPEHRRPERRMAAGKRRKQALDTYRAIAKNQ